MYEMRETMAVLGQTGTGGVALVWEHDASID